MLKQVGRTVYFKEARSYAKSSTATGRVTQAEEVSDEESDKECPTTMGVQRARFGISQPT